MLNLLRDPIWQFIGCFVGLLGIVIGAWISSRGQVRKLTYEVISQTPLLNFNSDSMNRRVRLLVDGRSVHNAEIVLIKIANTGSTPIKPDDYERPLRVVTGESSEILDVEIVHTNPKNLVVPISAVEDTSLTIGSILLNPKDSFVIQAVVIPRVEISVDGRIAGIKEIFSEGPKRRSYRIMTTSFIWILFIAFTVFIASGFTNYQTPFVIIAAGFSTFCGGVILPRLMDWIKSTA
jgi:hypothetical protein